MCFPSLSSFLFGRWLSYLMEDFPPRIVRETMKFRFFNSNINTNNQSDWNPTIDFSKLSNPPHNLRWYAFSKLPTAAVRSPSDLSRDLHMARLHKAAMAASRRGFRWVAELFSSSLVVSIISWWFNVTFLGWLSDLQQGDEKGTLNHLAWVVFITFLMLFVCFPFFSEKIVMSATNLESTSQWTPTNYHAKTTCTTKAHVIEVNQSSWSTL